LILSPIVMANPFLVFVTSRWRSPSTATGVRYPQDGRAKQDGGQVVVGPFVGPGGVSVST